MRRFALASAAALVLFVYACKDDDDHSHAPPSFPDCEEIAEACHEVDTGSGKPHECHEGAESATAEATCTAMKVDCLAACKGAGDGGATDAGGGG